VRIEIVAHPDDATDIRRFAQRLKQLRDRPRQIKAAQHAADGEFLVAGGDRHTLSAANSFLSLPNCQFDLVDIPEHEW
jgi:hypothetical protein